MKKMGIIAWVGLSFIFSCSLDSDEFRGPINSKINVTMLEDISGSRPLFQMLFESANLYECSNYNILMDVNAEDAKLDIVFNEIYKNSTCVSENGRAYNVYSIVDIVNGTYQISLKVKDSEAIAGTLVVTDTDYTLTLPPSDDFVIMNPHVYSMPEGMVWGAIQKYTENQQSADIVDEMFTLMSDAGLADTLLTEGDYTYFLIDDESKVSLRSQSTTTTGITSFVFYMDDKVNRDQLKQALYNFKNKYAAYVKLGVFDWKGTIY